VYTAHAALNGAAPDALHGAVAVNVFPGRSLETTIAVGGGTAVDAASFIVVVLMKPINAFGTAITVGGRTAIRTFGSHNFPLTKILIPNLTDRRSALIKFAIIQI